MRWGCGADRRRRRAFLRTPPSCRNIYPKLGWVGKKILKIVLDAFFATVDRLDSRHDRSADEYTTRCSRIGRHHPVFSLKPDKAHLVDKILRKSPASLADCRQNCRVVRAPSVRFYPLGAGGYYLAASAGLLLFAALAGCGGDPGERLQSGRVLALLGLQGRWVGPVLPMDPACGSATQGLMSIGDKGFGFDPFQSTTVIQGEVGKDGRLNGSLARLGSDHQNLLITFEGAASGSETISGTLQSGRCHWSVTMHRG